MKNYNIVVASAFGVEGVTKRELSKFGFDSPCEFGRFSFNGNLQDVANMNMFLRTAERVFISLGKFPANTFDELFDNIMSLNLGDFISKEGKILVKAKSNNSTLFALSALSSITKKAIVNNLYKYYKTSVLSESKEEYKIELNLKNNVAELLLDTSGAGLHKRGYRTLAYSAPLKETLAAAMIDLSIWNPDKTLIDPFCGSGTIPLEGAMIGLNMAPGILREFAFESFPFVPNDIMKVTREKAKDLINRDRKLSISGFDIDESAIKEALFHAKNLGVSDKVHFQKMDMKEVKSKAKYGVIICNPPYGERLMTPKEVVYLYKDFAKMFLSLDDFSAYVLTAMPEFQKVTGLKITKERKMFNGKIECRYYSVLGKKPPKIDKTTISQEIENSTHYQSIESFG